MSAPRPGRQLTLAAAVTGLLAAPLAVITAASPAHAATVDIQILATNDFHGRLADRPSGSNNPEPIEIASVMAGAVKQLEAEAQTAGSPTLFAAAGDMIGASTFESFIQRDKPTIDVLNGAGLDVSAAGNHEFDGGYGDLVNRVMKPYDATGNPEGGAAWQYLAANVRKKSDGSYALPDVTAQTPDANDRSDGGSWMTTVSGVDVGFVGAVTEDLPSLVSPAGIADLKINSIVAETNAAADALKAQGADLVVLLVHEGAATTSLASATDDSAFGRIVKGVDGDVNAIVSGHTHLAYNHTIAGRPVVSAGQYGARLNQLVFTVNTDPDANPATNDATVAVKSQQVVNLFGTDPDGSSGPKATPPLFPVDAPTKSIVDAAFTRADVLGARVLGKVNGAFRRARLANGDENRGGESTLSNLVAEVQRWATSSPEAGAAQIAFMNPGGLRADMTGNSTGAYPADLTYKQAAVVQPFANTLTNMKMTGAQIKKVLEQQWQRDDKGQVPTRPFLRLGASKGFFSTYDVRRPEGDRVTGMWLDGKPIEPATTYSVTANSFLAGGGDNFFAFREATGARDTGKSDLQAMVDYMASRTGASALPVDFQQRFVGVQWPAGKPRYYRVGEKVDVALSSLAMTHPLDARDRTLGIRTKDAKLFRAMVDNTVDATPFDESGRSSVSVRLTGKTRPGKQVLTFTGDTTGSTFDLPIEIRKALAIAKAKAVQKRVVANRTRTKVKLKVKALGLGQVFGNVLVKAGGEKYRAKLRKGKVVLRLDPFAKVGKKKIVVLYRGSSVVRGKRVVLTVDVKRR